MTINRQIWQLCLYICLSHIHSHFHYVLFVPTCGHKTFSLTGYNVSVSCSCLLILCEPWFNLLLLLLLLLLLMFLCCCRCCCCCCYCCCMSFSIYYIMLEKKLSLLCLFMLLLLAVAVAVTRCCHCPIVCVCLCHIFIDCITIRAKV